MSWWKRDPVVEPQQQASGPGAMGFLNRGIASTVGGAVDLMTGALNTGPVDVIRGLTGYDPLGPEQRAFYESNKREGFGGSTSLSRGMEFIGADVAQPSDVADTYPERIAEGVGLAAGTLLPGGAAVGGLRTAGGPVARGVAETVARPFLRQPMRATGVELTAGAGAGAGGLTAERNADSLGVSPAMARIAGELLGGLGAATAPGAAVRAARNYTPLGYVGSKAIQAGKAAVVPFTESGGRVRAARRLQELSGAPAEDAARVTGDTIGNLTPAQETGNPRLMALERAVRDADATLDRELAARSQEGNEALRQAIREPAGDATARDAATFIEGRQGSTRALLQRRIEQAQERANAAIGKLTPALKETQASAIVRRELDSALSDARAQERELWAAVPKAVQVPTSAAREAYDTFRGQLGRAQMDDLPAEAVRFLDPDSSNTVFGKSESVREVHALYSRLRETARQARAAGKPNQARIADGIADGVLRDLESADAGRVSLADAEDAFQHQQDVDRFFGEYDRLSREVAGFGKRPLTRAIIGRGGVDPNGPLAAELRHRGITSRTVPGLYRRGGLKDVDNIPASELEGLEFTIGEGGNGYASRDGIIEALAGENSRTPTLTPEQQVAASDLAAMEGRLPQYEKWRSEMGARVDQPFPGDFGPEVSSPLDAARAYSRELNQTFRQGRIGKVLGYEREGGVSTPAETTLADTIGTGGARAAVTADELRRATRGTPEAEGAMRDYMRRRFSEYASPRGSLNVGRAQDFLRENDELLDRFPDLKAQVEGAARVVSSAHRQARTDQGRADRIGDPKRSIGAAYAQAPFEREFSAVLRAQNPRAAAAQLARQTAKDQSGQAARGLKAAALDHLTRDFDPAKMRQILGDKRSGPAMAEVLGADDMARVNRVVSELERASAGGRSVGRVMDDLPNTLIQYAARVLAARVGAQAGQGTSGASLLTANLASQRMRDFLHGLTNDKAAHLLRDAMRDPELFRDLLTADLRQPAAAKRAETRLTEWLAAETGVAAGGVGEEPERQWWMNDPVADDRRSDAGKPAARPVAVRTSLTPAGTLGPRQPVPPRNQIADLLRGPAPLREPGNPTDAVVRALIANVAPQQRPDPSLVKLLMQHPAAR